MKKSEFEATINATAETAVTIYAPTHRRAPENLADPIVIKNLITKAEQEIAKLGDKRQTSEVRENLQAALSSIDFAHLTEGLAIFVSEKGFSKFDLLHSPAEKVVVSNTFVISDLVKTASKSFDYHLLVLGESPTKLFRGDRDSLTEMREGFPIEHTGRGGAQGLPTDFGQQTSVIEDEEHRKFFRGVLSRLQIVQKNEDLPLVVTGVERFLAFWSEVSTNQKPAVTIQGSYDFMSEAELVTKTWPVIQEHIKKLELEVLSELDKARSSKLYAGGFQEVNELAQAGRISVLVVSDEETANPVTEEAVRKTLETGGEVRFLPAASLTNFAPIAAVMRY
jgi:hypothetical protein